jgi:hypothetical protein
MALYPPAYKNAVEAQRVAMARIRNPECSDKTIAQLMRAFVDLEMLKLRLRMKPAPKPIDVSKPKKQGMPIIAPEE